jgi:splicing factor U2AF subunit
MANLYLNPAHDISCTMNEEQLQQHFDLFFEDMFVELAKYGEIEDLNVCDNVGDHLVGSKCSLDEDSIAYRIADPSDAFD